MKLYEELLVNGIPVAILIVILGKKIFKNLSFDDSKLWIRYILLIQCFLSISYLIYALITGQFESQVYRATGQHATLYIFMMLTHIAFPLILLHKKLGNSLWVLLAIGTLMNFGRIMESSIIFITSFHSSFGPNIPIREILTVVKGILFGIVLIGFDYLTKKVDLKPIGNKYRLNLNHKPFLLIIFLVCLYSFGTWLSSIYGLDPPYSLFLAGLTLIAIAIFTSLLLVFYFTKLLFDWLK